MKLQPVVLLFLILSLFACQWLNADKISALKKNVQHVVIFMQENRAFDHYYGTLEGVRGFDDRAHITLPSGLPVWYVYKKIKFLESRKI